MEQKRLKIVLLLTLVVLLLCSCATENLPAETQITINDTTEVGAMIDLYGDFTGSESDTSFADYPKAKLLTVSQDKTFSQNPLETTGEKTFLFSFVMKAKNVCTPVKISVIGENEIGETYYVPVQWTLIQMPMKLTQLSSVNLQFEGEVYLADAKIEYMGTTTLKNLSQQSGMHLLEDFPDVMIQGSDVDTGPTIDLVKVDNLIYSIGNGSLVITDVSDIENPVIKGRLSDLGSSIRQIAMLGDGKHVFISSRQNGCYIVNVSDPANPKLVSGYDSVEMATGVDVYGNYAFVCDRQYGVEIVDVSDVYNPVQCSIVRTGTAQSCRVEDGILYVGCWNERCIDMFDITQPSEPKFLSSASLNGKGDGMTILKKDGRTYLFAATGQHVAGVAENITSNRTEEMVLADLRFGQGNGLDIIDITDIQNPVWLSTSRIDGRYYFPNNDYWEVEVAEKDGHYYAYCMNTYNGVYIFNVDNPAAPIRLGRVAVKTMTGGIQHFDGRGYIFPYNQYQQLQSPIAAIACEDGVLYMASSMTAMHIYNGEELQPFLHQAEEKSQSVTMDADNKTFYQLKGESLGLTEFVSYDSTGQVYAVVGWKEKLYAACGHEGIVVLDLKLNKLATIATQGFALDVQIYEGTMYCAESSGGLGIYTLSDDGLSATEIWRYQSAKGVIRQVRLSSKGRWAVLQCGANSGEVITTLNPTEPIYKVQGNGQMYHHTILNTLVAGRYSAIWNEGGKVFWFDFGENDDYEEPMLMNEYGGNRCAINNGSMTGNVPGYPQYALATTDIAAGAKGGYVLYDPLDKNTPKLTASDPDTPFSGKPVIYENLLITSERINGNIQIVDISDIQNPNVIKTIPVNGNPDIPIVYEGYVYVPLGYQGLLGFAVNEVNNP